MNNKFVIRIIFEVIILTVLLTVFFYTHEQFPQPWRALTSILGTPVAIASGLSYYLHAGIAVYDSPSLIVTANLIASMIIIFLAIRLKRLYRSRHKK